MLFIIFWLFINHFLPWLLKAVVESAVGPIIMMAIGIALILSCIGVRIFHPKVHSLVDLLVWIVDTVVRLWTWLVETVKKLYAGLCDRFYRRMSWQTSRIFALIITVIIV